MTEFEITINGETETVHAKRIVNGTFLVKRLRTRNFSLVKYIVTKYDNDGVETYTIKTFYDDSKYHNRPITQKVIRIREIDE